MHRFGLAGLKLKPAKCHLLRQSVSYLGHVISKDGIVTDTEKVSALRRWPPPTSIDQLRSFLGLATYYRKFVRGFAEITTPLRPLTEKNVRFIWDQKCDDGLRLLKQITTSPILVYPSFDREFILDADDSDGAIGGVLSQQHQDGEHAIAFGSRALTKTEKPYSVIRKELLSLVYFLKHFRHYLYGYHVVVRTDHKALQWLRSFKKPESQVARCLEILEEYDREIHHRPGNKHSNSDALSRIPPTDAGLPLETFVLTERDASDSPAAPAADVLTRR